jgi:hypothetical protein
MRERLTADDVRNLEADTYIVARLHEDEYWLQGEGRVTGVTLHDSGKVTVRFRGNRGHTSRLHVPADARAGLTMDGAASGASDLRVTGVYGPADAVPGGSTTERRR